MRIIFAMMLALGVGGVAQAQSSIEYAQMGMRSWIAFECAVLATVTGDEREQERLFLYGYEMGHKFVDPVREGKVKREDLDSAAPLFLTLLLEGPSADFILGREWEFVTNQIYDQLKDTYKATDQEMRALAAEREFRHRNCALISGS